MVGRLPDRLWPRMLRRNAIAPTTDSWSDTIGLPARSTSGRRIRLKTRCSQRLLQCSTSAVA
eukprot:scaffold1000_cov166-Amphora_coffeaeformis.AAC.1